MKESDSEKIDAYLLGQFSDKEKLAFEHEVGQDADLEKEVRIRQLSIANIHILGDWLARQRIHRLHKKEIKAFRHRSRTIRRVRWGLIAAAVLFLIIASYNLFQTPSSTSDLFTNHYEAYLLRFNSRDLGDSSALELAGQAYRERRFADAFEQFSSIVAADSMQTKARLALGICAIELEQYAYGLDQFEVLIQANDPLYREQALWYAALLYLKQNELDKSTSYLEQLNIATSFYHDKAAQLLLEIERLRK